MKRIISLCLCIVLVMSSLPLMLVGSHAEGTAQIKNYHVTGTNDASSPTEFTFRFDVECTQAVTVTTEVWNIRGGKDDVRQYTKQLEESGNVEYTVKASDHGGKAGKYHIAIEVKNAANQKIAAETHDFYLNVPTVIPASKTVIDDGKLYVRVDARYYNYKSLFSSYMKLAEAPDEHTLSLIQDLVRDGFKAQYVLGGTRVGKTNTFAWSQAGSNVSGNWAPGQPDNTNNNYSENILAMYPATGKESDLKYNDLNEDALNTGFVLCIDLESIVPSSTSYYGAHKYEVFTKYLPWEIAQLIAAYRGGYLTCIGSAEENNFVHSFYRTADYLIGAYLDEFGNWQWSSGESFSYTNWYKNEPNQLAEENGQYFTRMYYSYKQWDDTNDTNTSFAARDSGFIIEYEPEQVNVELHEDEQRGISLDEITVNATFPNADKAVDVTLQTDVERSLEGEKIVVTAKDKVSGAQLASQTFQTKNGAKDYFGVVDVRIGAVTTTSYEYQVVGQCPGNGKFHIRNWTAENGKDDINTVTTVDEYAFTDTFKRTFSITAAERNNKTGLYYAEIWVENTDTGEISDVYNLHHFMKVPTVMEVAKTAIRGNKLYVRVDAPYSQYSNFSSKMQLAEAHDEDTLTFLKRFIYEGNKSYYIIGGKLSGSNWVWQSDNSPVDTNGKWAPDQPDNSGNAESQLSIIRASGYYNDNKTSYSDNGFVAMIDLDTFTPDISEQFSTNQYEFYKQALPFELADLVAQAKGGHLATITTAEEQAFVSATAASRRYTIGCRIDENGNLSWLTGEGMSYTNWRSGEPNNSSDTNGQYFVRMYENGDWDDCNDFQSDYATPGAQGLIIEYEPEFEIKVNQDNVHGITEDEVRVMATYPGKDAERDLTEYAQINIENKTDGTVKITAAVSKANGAVETLEKTVTPAGGHHFTKQVNAEADCENEGLKTFSCTGCGYTYTRTIPALGHVNEVVETPADCTQAGQRVYTCTRCGRVYTEVLEALGHDLQTEQQAAGCDRAGFERVYCTRCDYERVTTLPATGHSLASSVSVSPRKTARGYQSSTCTVCEEEIRENYVMPQAGMLSPLTLGSLQEISLKAKDEFAALRISAQTNTNVCAVALSEQLSAFGAVEITDAAYNRLCLLMPAGENNARQTYTLQAGKTYVFIAYKQAAVAAKISLALLGEQQGSYCLQTENTVATFSKDFTKLSVESLASLQSLVLEKRLLQQVTQLELGEQVTALETGILESLPALQQLVIRGENTAILGSSNALDGIEVSICGNSAAQEYLDSHAVEYTLLEEAAYLFDAAGGSICNSAVYRIRQSLLTEEVFASLKATKNNSRFLGWADAANPNFIFTSMPTQQAGMHLIAVWEEGEENNIVYIGDYVAGQQEGSVSIDCLENGDESVLIPVKIKNNTGLMGFKLSVEVICPIEGIDIDDCIRFKSIEPGEVAQSGLQDNLDSDARSDLFNVYWASNEQTTADGVLFYIRLNANTNCLFLDNMQLRLQYSQADTFNEDLEDVILQCKDTSIDFRFAANDSMFGLKLACAEESALNTDTERAVRLRLNGDSENLNGTFGLYDLAQSELVDFIPAEHVSGELVDDSHFRVQTDFSGDGDHEVGILVIRAKSDYAFEEVLCVSNQEEVASEAELLYSNFLKLAFTGTVSPLEIHTDYRVSKADANNLFHVDVNFENNHGIMGYKLNFKYDNSMLVPVSVENGSRFSSGSIADSIGVKPGEFSVLWNNSKGISYDGTAFTITFRKLEHSCQTNIEVAASAADSFNENWETVDIVAQDIQVDVKTVPQSVNIYAGEDGTAQLQAGNTVNIPVVMQNNPGLMGLKLNFEYNPDNLTPLSIIPAEVFDGGLQDNIDGDAVPGRFSVYWAGNENNDENGVMFYVQCQVADEALGTDSIAISYSQEDSFNENFEDVLLSCYDLEIQYQNSAVENAAHIALSLAENAPIYAREPFALNVTLCNASGISADTLTFQYDKAAFEILEFIPAQGIHGSITQEALSFNADAALLGDAPLGQIVLRARAASVALTDALFAIETDQTIPVYGGKIRFDVSPSQLPSEVAVTATVDAPDEKNQIKVHIHFENNPGIMGFKLKFNYSASMLEAISLTKGSLLKSGNLADNIGASAGEFAVNWQNTQNVCGDGEALVITFRAKDMSDSPELIELTAFADDCFDEQWNAVTLSCTPIPVNLNAQSGLCTFMYADLSAFGWGDVSGALTVWHADNTLAFTQPFENGAFTVNAGPAESFSVRFTVPKRVSISFLNIPTLIDINFNDLFEMFEQNGVFAISQWGIGDVNGSDTIDIGDVSALLMQANYGKTTQNAENPYCDLNDDGYIDMADLSMILHEDNFAKSAFAFDFAGA